MKYCSSVLIRETFCFDWISCPSLCRHWLDTSGVWAHRKPNSFSCRAVSLPSDYNYWYNCSLICALPPPLFLCPLLHPPLILTCHFISPLAPPCSSASLFFLLSFTPLRFDCMFSLLHFYYLHWRQSHLNCRLQTATCTLSYATHFLVFHSSKWLNSRKLPYVC